MDEKDAVHRSPSGEVAATSATRTGIRIALERDATGPAGPPWRYRGEVTGREAVFDVDANLAADGIVTITTSAPDAPEAKATLEKVRLLLRTLHRQANADGLDPPRRILRWRDA